MSSLFFFKDTATTAIYTLSLHDALPISLTTSTVGGTGRTAPDRSAAVVAAPAGDRKSTRLNSSHQIISYAVFCLKKKKNPTYSMATYPTAYASTTARTTTRYGTPSST